jgi:hypothetical protein
MLISIGLWYANGILSGAYTYTYGIIGRSRQPNLFTGNDAASGTLPRALLGINHGREVTPLYQPIYPQSNR